MPSVPQRRGPEADMSCWQTTWENMQPEDLRSPGWIECLRCGIEEQSDGATFDPDEDAWTCRGCLSVDEEHRRGAAPRATPARTVFTTSSAPTTSPTIPPWPSAALE